MQGEGVLRDECAKEQGQERPSKQSSTLCTSHVFWASLRSLPDADGDGFHRGRVGKLYFGPESPVPTRYACPLGTNCNRSLLFASLYQRMSIQR
eukprot:2937799-Rhodomonas_salina.2